ncbi:hypothetical protein N7489_003105 [Penicillium chrysogenum]|jgi:hypothetical protein|uniref:Uncharacterized protein n=1 Tax=Penicillium chrysogenum TaxID=5076 RepID=A0ABQ8W884_PENCH|nr:uncharacterized protein N7489_003105 [Penicillium chrysogenum]KAJ5252695.1 hypothetical protein N7489_003105 [Penicillium chrysogenum]KAJ5259932.1 hypothetical protein N7505_009313 [Penicillium chrysogenum]KAJ6142155.1 hypothetical protein N7497_011254 [Penicillium chrysogenum]
MEEIAPGPIRLLASEQFGLRPLHLLLTTVNHRRRFFFVFCLPLPLLLLLLLLQQHPHFAVSPVVMQRARSHPSLDFQSFQLCASGCTMSGRYSKDKPELQRRHPFLSVMFLNGIYHDSGAREHTLI